MPGTFELKAIAFFQVCSTLQSDMAEYSTTLFCSFEANVEGIKFYEGHLRLQSLMRVVLVRDLGNTHDCSAVAVKLVRPYGNALLGHLERHVAAAIASLMDRHLTGLIICGFVHCYNIII